MEKPFDKLETPETGRLREELDFERSRREALEREHASLVAAFDRFEGGLLLLDTDRILFASAALSDMFGIAADKLRKMTREQFLREIARLFDEPPDFLHRMRSRGFEEADDQQDFEIQRPSWRRIRWIGRPLSLPTGKGLLATFTDITQDSDLESDRKRQALTDELTGLSNRRAGEQAVARETARAIRTERPLSFTLFDVDHFKRINDTFGHATGDLVLQEVARFLQVFLRRGDTAIRWGGEEFLVIVCDVAIDGARSFAERVRKAIELLRVGDVGQITISAGTAELILGEDPEGTIARADANLYVAKSRGRNRVV